MTFGVGPRSTDKEITPEALANSSPGLPQPWDSSATHLQRTLKEFAKTLENH
jgi:hypothetical protein